MEQRGSRSSGKSSRQGGGSGPAEVLQLGSPAPSPARSLGKRSEVPFSPAKGSPPSPGARVHPRSSGGEHSRSARPSTRESPAQGSAHPPSSGSKQGSAAHPGSSSGQAKAGKENPPGAPAADSDIARANTLMERRLRERYGPGGMPEAAIKHVKQLRSDAAQAAHSVGVTLLGTAEAVGGKGMRKIIGKDVPGVVGQIVRHIRRGKHSDGHFDGDYFSGDETGTVISVTGDNAEVRWNNGNQRWYYVGATPFRKDVNGKDTDNARAIRCLVLSKRV